MAGLFGANRLGASSLTEIFVFGRIAGEAAAEQARELPLPDVRDAGEAVGELTSLYGRYGSESPTVLQRRLQKLMWNEVGICREERGLCSALREIEAIRTQSGGYRCPLHQGVQSRGPPCR
jgi:succinate dehydrogenase/fumarate reductase flavoprotein subunit